MSRCVVLALLCALAAGWAAADDDDFVMGNYAGEFVKGWDARSVRAQVVTLPMSRYKAVIYVGAPDAPASELPPLVGSARPGETRIEVLGRRKPGTGRKEDFGGNEVKAKRAAVIELEGEVTLDQAYDFVGQITNETFEGAFVGTDGAEFKLKRVQYESPTLGNPAPDGSVVLLAGKNLDAWNVQPHWQLQGDGSMRTVGSSITSKEEFGDVLYHVEFLCPFMPNDTGQARGNSGVYVAGRYEVQVLDSFTDEPKDNLCGGIYQKATPVLNACLPPLSWQTYDITFKAPRFDANGKKTGNAVITVVQNGVTIHDNVTLPDVTPGGVSGEEAAQGVLMLQDHGDAVRYRNVWVKPLD